MLAFFERAGQILTVSAVLIFNDYNLTSWSPWSFWLIISFALMVLYEIWWIRYFRSPKKMTDFYSSILGIPVAGATLPVAAFFLLGIYGKVIWLLIATDPEVRKQEIIDTAMEIFAEKSFEAVTMKDIAQAVGVATGLCYQIPRLPLNLSLTVRQPSSMTRSFLWRDVFKQCDI